jgi:hypothetical protein
LLGLATRAWAITTAQKLELHSEADTQKTLRGKVVLHTGQTDSFGARVVTVRHHQKAKRKLTNNSI